MPATAGLTISVVSHGQGRLVSALVQDLLQHCRSPVRLILTVNIPEQAEPLAAGDGLAIDVVRNEAPKGFAANHNAAFQRATGDFFCVLNPGIRLHTDPFPGIFCTPKIRTCAGALIEQVMTCGSRRAAQLRTLLGAPVIVIHTICLGTFQACCAFLSLDEVALA